MPEILFRDGLQDLQVRGAEGRNVFGIVLPYNVVATVADVPGRPYQERFVHGAFSRSIAERGARVKLLRQHNPNLLLGRAVSLHEDPSGLIGEFTISKTVAGDEALEQLRDGSLSSFSVGFRAVKERRASDGVVERTEAAIREASLVTFPSYDGALVAGVRDDGTFPSLEARQRRLLIIARSF